MAPSDPVGEKDRALREGGTLHSGAHRVRDPLFQQNDFFDPRDLVQVRYEMLRRVRAEGVPVTEAVAHFGVSRPTYYQALAVFTQGGLAGLVPRKRGPKSGHKLTVEVTEWIAARRDREPSLKAAALTGLVAKRFGVRVHPRSLERALVRLGEKRR